MGVCLFYDSQGKAIYAGKAKAQTLWTEMNRVFNRPRRGPISRVEHPTVNAQYSTYEEKARPIIKRAVPLYDLGRYFSAYRVDDGLINDVEASSTRNHANSRPPPRRFCAELPPAGTIWVMPDIEILSQSNGSSRILTRSTLKGCAANGLKNVGPTRSGPRCTMPARA